MKLYQIKDDDGYLYVLGETMGEAVQKWAERWDALYAAGDAIERGDYEPEQVVVLGEGEELYFPEIPGLAELERERDQEASNG